MKLNLVVLHEDFVNILMSFLNTRLPRGKALIKPVNKNVLDFLLHLQFLCEVGQMKNTPAIDGLHL